MKVTAYIDALIKREGGFVDHPSDKGGPTCWGITERVARENGYRGRMQDLPRETAFEIYLNRYWQDPRFDKINAMSEPLAEKLLDQGVNCGVKRATRWLQICLNLLNQQQRHYADIEVDGDAGNQTRYALSAYLKRRGGDGVTVLLRMLNCLQGDHYITFGTDDTKQEDFMFGWFLNRVQ
jgi:lysozyme family protein